MKLSDAKLDFQGVGQGIGVGAPDKDSSKAFYLRTRPVVRFDDKSVSTITPTSIDPKYENLKTFSTVQLYNLIYRNPQTITLTIITKIKDQIRHHYII